MKVTLKLSSNTHFICSSVHNHVIVIFLVQTEPGDDPEVVRAKYFIRDEFLVSFHQIIHHHTVIKPTLENFQVSFPKPKSMFFSQLKQINSQNE